MPTSGESTASTWVWVIVGVALLAVIYDQAPWLGGWLLLLIVIGLALSSTGRNIIIGGGTSRTF